MFQYLGSRGAQQHNTEKLNQKESFNTWAREEPNFLPCLVSVWVERVSILGLARSPTQGAQKK